jgi:signal transduction histidine kinase
VPSAAELIARTVGLQQTTPEILVASARISRQVLGTDSTFMAVADGTGAYPMSITDGIKDPQFREITVRPSTGLGGLVLLRRRPHRVADYLHDPTISRDFVHVVCDVEGLHGMACVPVNGPDRIEALLYTGTRAAGPPPDQTLRTLELVAAHAEISLHQEAVRKQETELAMLRDRQRIAIQLHDSVAQMLFTIGVAAHYARQQADPAALTAALEEIEDTAAQARSELRASLRRLSQPAEGLAFEARLAGEARLFERITGCRVKITERGARRDIPQPVEDLLIDTALEGLRNAVKYTNAQAATVHLAYQHDAVTLVLQAGTQILRPAHRGEAGHAGTGAGLALLRQRAAQLRGTLRLTCDPAGHTLLRLELPTRPFWRSPP